MVRSETKIEGPSGTITKTESLPVVSEVRVAAEPVVAEVAPVVENVPLVKSVLVDHAVLPEIRSEVIHQVPAVESLITRDTSIHGVDGSLIRKTESVPVISDAAVFESVPVVKSALLHEPLLKSVIVDREIPATRTVIESGIPATRTVISNLPVTRTVLANEAIPVTRTVVAPEVHTEFVSRHGLPLNTVLNRRVLADDLFLRSPAFYF